ncbi:MAG: hypothetical protein E4H40_03540 [Candidatus Brocadiia bacterium]|nr:MAG: hypothetical protein E4H40_03540 [Candidatus Brocadiia bacterium]
MPKTEARATGFLLQLGTAEQIRASAQKDIDLPAHSGFNSHIHLPPNFSAFQSVQQAVTLAAEQDIKVLGVGNYYDFSVYRQFSQEARSKGIFPLFGTEIIALEADLRADGIRVNDPGNPGKYYICGKGITRFEQFSKKAAELIGMIRRNDVLRMREMTRKLSEVFREEGIDSDPEDKALICRLADRYGCDPKTMTLQERHLCQVFQEVFFEKVPEKQRLQKLADLFGAKPQSSPDDAAGIQNEIRSHLIKAGKKCFVPETFITLAQAKELILELGGVPCYPVLADGSKQLCEYETPVEKLIDTLKANNFSMVEFIPIRNQPDILTKYVTAIRQSGIAVVAGTEHNTLDMLPIEPACADRQNIPDAIKKIFLEGICVLAGHQFLKANGQCGFVDQYDRPSPNYNSSEERIREFSKIGAAVLDKYFKKIKDQEKWTDG